jgi:hypothetical protein
VRRVSAVARLTAAVVCVAALVARLVWSLGVSGPIVANFFSYFTMQSAIAAAVLWTIGGVVALRHPVDPPWLVAARAVVTSYQIVAGIVFALLTIGSSIRGLPMPVPFSSDVLHYWLTLFAILDWVLAPGRPTPTWRPVRVLFVYPVLWGVYTYVRGESVGWFPYFFLDPALSSTTETVGYLALAAALIVAAFAGLTALGRRIRPLGPAVGPQRVEPQLLVPSAIGRSLRRPPGGPVAGRPGGRVTSRRTAGGSRARRP